MQFKWNIEKTLKMKKLSNFIKDNVIVFLC